MVRLTIRSVIFIPNTCKWMYMDMDKNEGKKKPILEKKNKQKNIDFF